MYNPDANPQAPAQQGQAGNTPYVPPPTTPTTPAQPVKPATTNPIQTPPYADNAPAVRKPLSQQTIIIGSIFGVAPLAALIVLGITGELFSFLQVGIVFIPLSILAAFAYAGVKNSTAEVFAYIMLALVLLLLFLNSLIYVVFGYIQDWPRFTQLTSSTTPITASSLEGIFAPNAGGGILLGLMLLLLAAVLSASLLFKPVRVMASRIVPIDPNNFVHKIALPTLAMMLLSTFIPLIVLGGTPPLLTVVNGTANSPMAESLSAGPQDIIYQFVWTIPAALIAAGWPIARRIRPALERLGFVRPTRNQVIFGVVFGVALAFIASYAVDPGINWVWRTLGWQTTDSAAFEKLLSNLITPFGAILIGVTAGVGEEMAVRGLLQPRIGLIASNLVFTGLHAFQYGPDALLSVFVIGLILGIIRARTNTTTSAIVHGIYDFTLVLWSVIVAGS